MELTVEADNSMDCEHHSCEDEQEQACPNDKLKPAFNMKDSMAADYYRASMGITFS